MRLAPQLRFAQGRGLPLRGAPERRFGANAVRPLHCQQFPGRWLFRNPDAESGRQAEAT